jgi:chemotaxis response regulator CheB
VLPVEALRQALSIKSEDVLLWVVHSSEEAVAMCANDTPDLLLLDLRLPGLGGLEATRQIMARSPCAILIATSSIGQNGACVFEAMGYGALDVVEVRASNTQRDADVSALTGKIATLRGLIQDRGARQGGLTRPPTGQPECLLAIGASAGGPAALAKLLGALPISTPAAIVIVQHVDAQFARGMADWLALQSAWPVRVALEGDRPVPGTALLAGTSDHLVFKSGARLGYTSDPPDCVYRPSIDVFFHTLVREWRGNALGVLLTGMGRDGAQGLRAMRDKGHYTVAQDEASSAVFGMPKAAARIDAAVDILSLEEIAPRLRARALGKAAQHT